MDSQGRTARLWGGERGRGGDEGRGGRAMAREWGG